MIYKLKFKQEALKEWRKLDNSLKEQFKKKLKERLCNPCVQSDKLSEKNNRFKIKLRNGGYRLVYEVREFELIIVVIAVGKRQRDKIYKTAGQRYTAITGHVSTFPRPCYT